jgi:MYXO-CTERM domain-containing protein
MSLALLALALCQPAAALPVSGGAQVALYPRGIDLATGWFEGETYTIEEPVLGGEYSCWDEVGIRDFSLEVPVETVEVTLREHFLDVRVEFGTIHGEDMEVYSIDADYFDTCVEFESELRYLTVTDGVFEASLQPRVEAGELVLEVLGEPAVTGDLDMDIAWFPDDLVLYFYEETIFETMSEAARSMIPELAATAFDASMLSGAYDDYSVTATLDDAQITTDAVWVGADLEATWLGSASCDPGQEQPGAGREPALDMSDAAGSTMAVGLTEWQLNALLRQLQADGFFCFDPERMDYVYEAVEELFDPGVVDLAASADIGQPPIVVVEPSGAAITFQGLALEVRGELAGQERVLLAASADLQAQASIGVDPTLASLTMSLHELELEILSIEADHLLSDAEDAEEHLVDFLEGWVAEWVAERVQGMALLATQYRIFGTYLRLDSATWKTGGVIVHASLYAEDDPAVDLTPPDTQAWVLDTEPSAGTARIAWTGNDDVSTELAFSSQLDGQGWSSWTTETELVLDGLLPGAHEVEVKARDGWLNEDPSPASAAFELGAVDTGEGGAPGRCGCAGGGTAAGGWLALLALLGLRRRREG